MSILEDAILLAVEAHRGQVDKAKQPYILHPLRVMLRLETDTEKIVGVLHDIVEDTDYTLERLAALGFPPEVTAALDCLTKRKSEPYESFIERVCADPLARRVKIADLNDNLDLRRLPSLTCGDCRRANKYLRALAKLQQTQ